MRGNPSSVVEVAYRAACALDVQAFKPGNVSEQASGHDMRAEDFHRSAEVTAPIMADPSLRLGQRIHRCVAVTQEQVGCNTNLGILLLCAPLAQACLEQAGAPLRSGLARVLREARSDDARHVFQAIALANPGGLGHSDRFDVSQPVEASLGEAMAYAADRDLIARQYANGFLDLFQTALPALRAAEARGPHEQHAVTGLYLFLLSRFIDSHVQRKQGQASAERLRATAQTLYQAFPHQPSSDTDAALRRLDAQLKAEGINPGTTADLTVATLFIGRLSEATGKTVGPKGRHTTRRLLTAMSGAPLLSTLINL